MKFEFDAIRNKSLLSSDILIEAQQYEDNIRTFCKES